MFKIMKRWKCSQPKSKALFWQIYVNSAAGLRCGSDWKFEECGKHQEDRERSVFTEVPFRISQSSKEAQNCFKNTERRLAFWCLVVRPGVGAQFYYSCRQGLAWIRLLSCNPDPGTKGESTWASWSTCLHIGQREKGGPKKLPAGLPQWSGD